MKVLNIDDFAKVTRQITLGGKSYPVEELSVQQFIDNLKAAEDLEASGAKVSMADSFEKAVTAIRESIPTLPEAEIRKLKLPAMTAVLQFIRGDLEPGIPAANQEGEASAKKPT